MREFLRKVLLFPLSFLLTYSIIFLGLSLYLNHAYSEKDAVFIWGDSQAYQGLDLRRLSSTTNREFYTSAHHGAGVYDFLVFTERVPNNSEIIVAISKLVQVRRKENDYNRSGLSIWALKQLFINNYSIGELATIIRKNFKPRSTVSESTEMWAYADTMKVQLPLSHFRSYYEAVPPFLEDKQNLYLVGIENLIAKNCKITLIELPFHEELENIENQSPIKKKTDDFINRVENLFESLEIDTIQLMRDSNIFSDLSHLNCVGADDLSKKLGERLLEREQTTLYIAQ